MSLPSRERGLKLLNNYRYIGKIMSLPSRERGLKSEGILPETDDSEVAPFAGAWIEILLQSNIRLV